MAFHKPELIQSTMKVFECTAIEAQQYLDAPIGTSFIFSSGKVYDGRELQKLINS